MRTIHLADRPLGALLEALTERLKGKSETPALDAQTLLAHILQCPRAWILAHPEVVLDARQVAALDTAAQRLESGQPLPYVLGKWEFFSLTFTVTPAVLIPRPETELLVERALTWLRAHPGRVRVADVGTGSGCIGVTLALHIPHLHVFAVDLSLAALRIAQHNAAQHGVAEQISLVCADLMTPFASPCDVLIANLPYIPTKTLHSLPVYGREPSLALNGGPDGLTLIRCLLEQAPRLLAEDGLLLLEIEASQGPATRALAASAFENAEIILHQDLAGRDRVLEIRPHTLSKSE